MKKNKLYIIIISVVLITVIFAVSYMLLSKKEETFVNVRTSTKDSVILDFGEWKGKQVNGTQFFQAELENIDEFVAFLKQTDCFDEKLFFKKAEKNFVFDTYYLVKNNRVFLLQIDENIVELKPMESEYLYIDYFSDRVPIMYAMVDVWSTNYDTATKTHGSTFWRNTNMTFENIKYLYQKLDNNIFKIEDDKIYIKCMLAEINEDLSVKEYKFHDRYSIVIYESNEGMIVDPIYNE